MAQVVLLQRAAISAAQAPDVSVWEQHVCHNNLYYSGFKIFVCMRFVWTCQGLCLGGSGTLSGFAETGR